MSNEVRPVSQWGWPEWIAVLIVPAMLLSPSIAHAIGWKWLYDATIWMLVILLGVIPSVMLLILPFRVLWWLFLLVFGIDPPPRSAPVAAESHRPAKWR